MSRPKRIFEAKYRGHFEQLLDMIEAIGDNEGINFTGIMYCTNINSNYCKIYVEHLKTLGMLVETLYHSIGCRPQRLFSLTDKGKQAYSTIMVMNDLLGRRENQKLIRAWAR